MKLYRYFNGSLDTRDVPSEETQGTSIPGLLKWNPPHDTFQCHTLYGFLTKEQAREEERANLKQSITKLKKRLKDLKP